MNLMPKLVMRKSKNLLVLDRTQIAFRKRYRAQVENQTLTTVFRPGNRIFPRHKGYRVGEVVTARIIEVPGSDALCIPPKFNEFVKRKVQIYDAVVKDLDSLTDQDFVGSSSDVFDKLSLRDHLESIYERSFAGSQTITKFNLRYL